MPEIAQFKVVLPNHGDLKPNQALDACFGFFGIDIGIEVVFPAATEIDQFTPQLSGFPPPVDGFGVAKADED